MRIAISISAAYLLLGALTALPVPSFGAVPPNDCDRFGASPLDPNAVVEGVAFKDIDTEKALAACEQATRQFPNEARFHFQLGRALTMAKRNRESIFAYRRALALHPTYAVAMTNLGIVYQQPPVEDAEASIEWLTRAADLEMPIAAFNLGTKYARGLGVEQDVALAARWLEKAASQGFTPAKTQLGLLFLDAKPPNRERARSLLEEAAAEGDGWAHFGLGRIHEGAAGGPVDLAKAAHHYLSAAQHDIAPAIQRLARMYERGQGVGKNEQAALQYYLRASKLSGDKERGPLTLAAARLGHVESQIKTASNYRYGYQGMSKNEREALRWYQQAAKSGNPKALNELGGFYLDERNDVKDPKRGLKLVRQAAKKGLAEAQVRLGSSYEGGYNGVKRNPREAEKLYRRAAEGGDSTAMVFLAKMLYKQRRTEATVWAQRAVAANYVTSHGFLAKLYEEGFGVPRDYQKAADLYLHVRYDGFGALSHKSAKKRVGELYAQGLAVPPPPEKKEPSAAPPRTPAPVSPPSPAAKPAAATVLSSSATAEPVKVRRGESVHLLLGFEISTGEGQTQCCPGKVAPSDGKSRPFNVLWPVLPGNDLKSRGRKWSPERSIRTRHNEG